MGLGEALRQARMRRKLTASQVAAETHMKMQVVEALEHEDFSKMAAPIYAKGFIKLYAEHVGLAAEPLIQDYMERFGGARPGPAPALAPPEAPPEPAPDAAPAEAPPEPDLFDRDVTRGRERRGILLDRSETATPEPDTARLGSWAAAAGKQAGARLAGLGTGIARAVRTGAARVAAAGRTLADNVRARARELSQINFRSLTPRHAAALVGVLLLVLFVLSSLTRCIRRTGPAAARPSEGRPALPLAVDPPDAYIE